jgi:hypothetical protein
MKKIFICLILIFIVFFAIFFNWYTNKVQTAKDIASFNSELEQFTNETITGVDLTTLINKAIDNNEKNKISKNSKKIYEDDGKYSLEISIKLTEDGEYFPMEALEQIGVSGFTKAYASALFKVNSIDYHDNGRISKISFEIIN